MIISRPLIRVSGPRGYWMTLIVGKPDSPRKSVPIMYLFYSRISLVPPFAGLHCFPQGRQFVQWTGDDLKVLMKVCWWSTDVKIQLPLNWSKQWFCWSYGKNCPLLASQWIWWWLWILEFVLLHIGLKTEQLTKLWYDFDQISHPQKVLNWLWVNSRSRALLYQPQCTVWLTCWYQSDLYYLLIVNLPGLRGEAGEYAGGN